MHPAPLAIHPPRRSDDAEPALDTLYPALHELAGRGATRVYVARDAALDRLVVVKALTVDEAPAGALARFRREVRVTAHLQHPNVVPVLAAGRARGVEFYVMPYLAGPTLAERMHGGPMRIREALRIAHALAGALDHVHRRGVVHRDVKPANVVLADGHPVLLDFGIACSVAPTPDEHITLTGSLVGAPVDMSPEQCTGEGGLDGRADVYALGCVLYEMLTGRPPFCGRQDVVLCRRMHEAPPPASALRPSVPAPVDRLVARSLAPHAADRFVSAAELADALAAPALSASWRSVVRGWLGETRAAFAPPADAPP